MHTNFFAHNSNHFIMYEVDNISNFESHRYGCSKRLMSCRNLSMILAEHKKTVLDAVTSNTVSAF